ncbi:MAG: 23S rRNA (uracil(1939)-C(5))-methyltransferase RlmD, partial [Lachnospiraceae bacterium]|nr:23S rRNA (uracil(1939)-C(5))-methyltransferase RlmD [Lachnospiraceae bacterium]
MGKRCMKPGNMVYPLPAALVSCADKKGNTNLITVAWTGTICSEPAMLYISVRPERYSYHMIEESGEFVLNLTNEAIIKATDLCGVKSGRDVDKWRLTGLTPEKAFAVSAPLVRESPVSIECKVVEIRKLGSHDMFIAEVVSVDADEKYFDKEGRLNLNEAGLVAYSHGDYLKTGDKVGSFGYSVKKKKCDLQKKCGGCSYINIPYDMQLKMKQDNLERLLGGFGNIDTIIGMDNPYYYRNKVHHVFDYDKKLGTISGVYQEKSHRVVNVDDCLIEDKKSQEIIATIRRLCKSFKIKTYDEDTGYGLLRHVLIRRGFSSGEIMVVLVLGSQILPGKNNFVKALRTEHPEITTIVINVNDQQTSMVLGDFEKPIYGPGFIRDKLCGNVFRISPKSFYQVNPVQTEVLYEKAIEFAGLTGKETVLDAYCGIGTIGICAASKAKKVIGIELNPDAVRDARINAKENNVENIEFFCDDATKWILKCSESIDVVLMDPPRTGSTEKFIKTVAKLVPKKVVYVSCGPETLARDLKIFENHGYKINRIQPVDMFPHTGHVE